MVDTLLEVESTQISWAYGTRAIDSPCLNAGYHASRPENFVVMCGKNKKVAHVTEQTHGNLESICFI